MSRLNTAADRPYSVSLATRTASSSPLTRTTQTHRAERLLAVDAHRGVTRSMHGRRHQRARRCVPPATSLAPLLTASSIRLCDAARGIGADQRAQRRHGPCADRRRPAIRPCAASLVDERVGDLLVDDDPLGRHADLALVHEGAEGRGVHRLVDVGVVEHDQRRLAAEFEQRRLQVLGRDLGDDPADPGRAGEIDAPHRRMARSAPRPRPAASSGALVTTLTTPGGRPASRRHSAISRCVPGQISEAFSTTVLPQASGMATARTPRMTGAFHGAMPSTTPAGWRMRHGDACPACRRG